MNRYKIIYSVKADGHNLLWDIENDIGELNASNYNEAIKKLIEHCNLWGYNNPKIESIEKIGD